MFCLNSFGKIGALVRSAFATGQVQVDLTLPPGGTAGGANAINNSGVMAGWATVTGFYQPCKWSVDGTPTVLALPAGGTAGGVTAINNSGVMAGWATVTGVNQPCKWSVDGTPTVLALPAGATGGSANAINSSGGMGGNVIVAGVAHAAVWLADGTAIDAGTFGLSSAYFYGINDLGVVVGEKANNDWSVELPIMAIPATYN